MTIGVLPPIEPYIEIPASNAGYYVFLPSSTTGMKSLWTINDPQINRPFNDPDGRGYRFEFKLSLLTATTTMCSLFGATWNATDSYYNGASAYPGTALLLQRSSGGLGSFLMIYGTNTTRAATRFDAYWDGGVIKTNMTPQYDTDRFASALDGFVSDQPKTVVVDIATHYMESSIQTGAVPSLFVSGRSSTQKKALWSLRPFPQRENGLSTIVEPCYLLARMEEGTLYKDLPPGSRLYSFKASRTKPFGTGFSPDDDLTEVDEVIWDFVPAANGRLYDKVSQSYVSPTGGTLTTVGTTLH